MAARAENMCLMYSLRLKGEQSTNKAQSSDGVGKADQHQKIPRILKRAASIYDEDSGLRHINYGVKHTSFE